MFSYKIFYSSLYIKFEIQCGLSALEILRSFALHETENDFPARIRALLVFSNEVV